MTQRNFEEVSVASNLYEPALVVLEPKAENVQAASNIHTYHPTRWPFINHILDIVDSVTGGRNGGRGRAGWVQRFFSFVFIGGIASLVNLAIFYVMYYHVTMPVSDKVHNIIAYVIAAEISIVANFIPNDYFTFRHLPGHERSWSARCLRYHVTASTGVVLTFLIEFGLTYAARIPAILAQAIAILIILFYNFTVHHLFTYRHVKTVAAH